MTKELNKKKLFEILANIFQVPLEQINDDSSPDTIENWDSLSQLNLLMSIESEFSISISAEDAADMISVSLIRSILADNGVEI